MPCRHRILAISTLLMLAACGGGGGDSGTGSGSLNSSPSTQPPAQPQTETYAAAMSGAEQVPPRITSAQGSGSVGVDPATRQMTASVTLAGMTATAVTLHQGAPGSTGPILFSLLETAPGSGVWTGRASLSVGELAALRAGQFYLSAASAAFTSGEIRGQLALRSGAVNPVGGPTGTAALR
ncbi:CHRD domain-containing protein [Noviherbaspirillum aerium]|uniref:CHRD domain-containing protein n=1 Tax=Noviherbaspirillum aerium TaxID=2588497 RepID=UPI00124C7AD1|nr:CHRD domain-containing protein [Noviherbaspirillum aerium]